MKNRTALYTLIGCAVLAAAAIASCSLLSGCANTTPPNKVERILFDTVTNYVAVFRTNEVVVPIPVTNVVVMTITNEQHQVITTTNNYVNETWHTNQAVVPALEAQYTQVPKETVKADVGMASGVLNYFLPGSGPIVLSGVLTLLAGWGHWRSRSKGQTAVTLVQELEVARTFLKSLPNGAAYDEALVSFLAQHQAEAGVVKNVVGILASKMSDRDVADGANGIVDYINSLKSVTTTLPPITVSAV